MAIFTGTAGNDRFTGRKAANDVFIGLQGNDSFRGNGARDLVDYSQDVLYGATKGIKVNLLGNGSQGGLRKDTAIDSFGFRDKVVGVPNVIGTQFSDKIYGGSHANSLSGGAGNDLLSGHNGNDKLLGGLGLDKLIGGRGGDKLFGGADADAFVFTKVGDSTVGRKGRDVIQDFSQEEGDRINLKAIDAKDGPRNQKFAFIEDAAFHGKAGELRYEVKGSTTFVYGDTDGNGKADFAIVLKGAFDLARADFVL